MKISRTWIVIIGILTIGGWYWYFFMRNSSPTMTTTTSVVKTGSIRTTVKSTGKISPIQTSTLTFSRQWTLTKLSKKVGDRVKTGDVIAEIDASSAYLDIESAKISLSNARNSYNKIAEWSTLTEKIRAENTLSESKSRLTNLEKTLENLILEETNTLRDKESTLVNLEQKVEIASGDLEYAQKNIETDTSTTNLERDTENAFLILEDIERIMPDIIKSTKDIQHIEDKNSPLYGDLSSKDVGYKYKVETAFLALVDDFAKYKTELLTLRSESPRSFSGTLTLMNHAKTFLDSYATLVWSTMIYEIDSSPETDAFPYSLHESYKTTLRGYASTLNTKIGSLNGSLSTLKWYGTDSLQALADKNTLTQKTANLTSAKNDLIATKANLEQLKKSYRAKILSAEWDIQSQKDTIRLNEASYKDTIDWAETTDITSAKNSIKNAEISLEKARLSLEDFQIIAPFDGVINDIPYNIWDTTTASKWILIENKNMYEIIVSLDQIDIVKVKPNMPAKIILDAFPKETYTGSVATISAVPTETSGVVSYEATIVLSIPREDIYSKMSTTVEIITAEKNNIIVISPSETTTSSGKTYVRAISWGSRPTRKEVILWISDGTKVEVLSWLTIWDKIIKVSSSSWSIRSSASTARNQGGFGGWRPPWL
jgi:RND family efflux transporter MFP subunit